MTISKLIKKVFDLSMHEKSAADIFWIRLIVYGFFAYRLICSGFSIFSYAPKEMLSIYPWNLLGVANGYEILGLPFLVDLADFHWIHWFLPLPSQALLAGIQVAACLSCFAVILFGRGHKNVLAIVSYVLLSYLWGFLWQSGFDVDSVFIFLQICLLFCFLRQPEFTLLNRDCFLSFSKENGFVYSVVILIFVGYYFASGLHKLTDISLIGWFQQDLAQVISRYYTAANQLGGPRWGPPLIHYVALFPFFARYIATPLVYASHLTVPLIYFYRRLIPKYLFFYFLFHAITAGVGIFFPGLIIGWFVFVPMHRLKQRVICFIDYENKKINLFVKVLKKADIFSLIQFNDIRTMTASIESKLETSLNGIVAYGDGSPDINDNFYAFRRTMWVTPLLWPVMCVLYLPLITTGCRLLYNYTVNAE